MSTALKFIQATERWQCGYGAFDPEAGILKSFTKLPHLAESAWQGGPKLQDEKLGWCMLNKEGGHPGHGLRAIRSSTLAMRPRDGIVSIRGRVNHRSDMGDGVRTTIVSSRSGKLGQWSAKQKEERTVVNEVKVSAGDTIDFVTDCITDESHDIVLNGRCVFSIKQGGESLNPANNSPAIAPLPHGSS